MRYVAFDCSNEKATLCKDSKQAYYHVSVSDYLSIPNRVVWFFKGKGQIWGRGDMGTVEPGCERQRVRVKTGGKGGFRGDYSRSDGGFRVGRDGF